MPEDTRPAPPQADSLWRALRRTLHPRRLQSLAARAVLCVRQRGWQALGRAVAFRVALMLHRDTWRFRADIPLRRELRRQGAARFACMPCVSILVPLWRTPPRLLRQLIKSVRRQSYANWQLVLADATEDDAAAARLHRAAARRRDARILYRRLAQNGGIAANTNAALGFASGEWLALLDHDDVLAPNALYEVVRALNETGATVVYSDEIVLDSRLRRLVQYHFKPDFCPEELQGCNYITHFLAFSRAALAAAGGALDSRYDGAQDYDLILRLTEKAPRVAHVPKVLYYWRGAPGSTAGGIEAKPYAMTAGQKALAAHFARLGLAAQVEIQPAWPGTYRPILAVQGQPTVSVLIPNKDHVEDLQRCLESLYAHAGWPALEVLVIENNSTAPATFAYYEQAQRRFKNLRVLTFEGPFNFSAINNFAAAHAAGEHLLLLNNDVELITDGFVREMLSYSQQEAIGAVGAKLLYPDGTIQHAGIILGIGGTAGHSHKGLDGANGGDLARLVTTQNYQAVTGACLMVKAALYRRLGGLDEQAFAVAFNDVDFCLRLTQQGLRNVYTPYACATHYESKSRGYDDTGANSVRFAGEKAAFLARWGERIARGDPCYNPHFTYLYENYGYR